jgi:hypothetical protein
VPRFPFVLAAAAALAGAACSSVTTVRLHPEAVEVGPNLRPLAGIQADAISAQVFFVSIPGVDLDRVVNQMLVVAAKTMGADKVANLRFEITPDSGFWAWRRFLGWRSARASGIAVQVTAPAPDPFADEGPEPPGTFPPEGLGPGDDPPAD